MSVARPRKALLNEPKVFTERFQGCPDSRSTVDLLIPWRKASRASHSRGHTALYMGYSPPEIIDEFLYSHFILSPLMKKLERLGHAFGHGKRNWRSAHRASLPNGRDWPAARRRLRSPELNATSQALRRIVAACQFLRSRSSAFRRSCRNVPMIASTRGSWSISRCQSVCPDTPSTASPISRSSSAMRRLRSSICFSILVLSFFTSTILDSAQEATSRTYSQRIIRSFSGA